MFFSNYLKHLFFSSKAVTEISVTKSILRSCYLLSHVPFNVKLLQKPVIYMPIQRTITLSKSTRETLKKV